MEDVVWPSIRHSLFSAETRAYLGLPDSVVEVPAPLLEDPDESDETRHFFFLHFRLAVSMLWHCLLYSVQPQSAPWAWCLFLSDNPRVDRDAELARLVEGWDVVKALEASNGATERALLKRLPIRTWAVFREPFELLEAAGGR
eukprot:4573704-Alexandrium_andersonii.AAC.1